MSDRTQLAEHESQTIQMRSGSGLNAVIEITGALRQLLADAFALYLKTKNFHWHVSVSIKAMLQRPVCSGWMRLSADNGSFPKQCGKLRRIVQFGS